MERKDFDKYVEERYENQLAYYDRTATRNQKKYRRFQWLLIVLSAMTPVLAALSGRTFSIYGIRYAPDLQIAVVIISALVAILTTGLKTFSYQELWTNYRAIYEKLKPEIHYYQFGVGPYSASAVDKESLFVTRVEAMLDAEHSQWPPANKLQESHDKAGEDARSTAH